MSGLAVLDAVCGVCVVCLSGGICHLLQYFMGGGGVRWLILCLGWEKEELSIEVGLVFCLQLLKPGVVSCIFPMFYLYH